MFVVYSSRDETIITDPEKEAEMLKLYFDEGGRDRDDYDRSELNECAVSVQAAVKVD